MSKVYFVSEFNSIMRYARDYSLSLRERMQRPCHVRMVVFLLLVIFADMLSLLSVMSAVWVGS